MKYFSRKKIFITIFSIAFFYLIFTIYSGSEKIGEIYLQIHWMYLIPIFCILFFSVFFRSILQRFLLKNIGITLTMKESFELFLAGFSMIITPGGSGIIIKSFFLQQKYGFSLMKTIPFVFAERIYELIGVIILISITLLIYFSEKSLIVILVATIIVSFLLYSIKSKKIIKFIFTILNKILPFKISLKETEFIETLNKLFTGKMIFRISSFGGLITFMEGFMFYFGFLAFDLNFDYLISTQIFYTSILFGSLFLLPAGVGATEGFFVTSLIQNNIDLPYALSLILFLRLFTIWLITGVGFVVAYIVILKHEN